MIHSFRGRGEAIDVRQTSGLLLSIRARRLLILTAWLSVSGLLTLAGGCGGGSAKKAKESTAVAEAQPAQEEEKDAAAEAPPPAAKKKKQAFVMIPPAKVEAPAAPSTDDITKWKAADLDAAFARKDFRFAPAVVFYSVANRDDAKRAEELEQLAQKVARMKDDSAIPVPFPPGAFTASEKQSAATLAQPGAAAAKEEPAAKGVRSRFGKNRKKDKGQD
jgi:hypothetical protein